MTTKLVGFVGGRPSAACEVFKRDDRRKKPWRFYAPSRGVEDFKTLREAKAYAIDYYAAPIRWEKRS